MTSSAAHLRIRGLQKIFDGARGEVVALTGVDLDVRRGEIITVIGPSGCGKSTLLKIVAGLETEYEGVVELDGRPVHGPGPSRAVIFQEHRLFPWLNVARNIAGNLSLRSASVRVRVEELLRVVKLEGFANAFPKELSGGMAQRVSIARALLRDPEVLLLDEPFGALDAFTRSHMQDVLRDIWRERGTTMIFVTHDIDEALVLGDRVVVMSPRPGRVHEIIPVTLPVERDRASDEFLALRAELVRVFGDIAVPDESDVPRRDAA
ncbi:Aliphatic sulfonates import ATP-binding protein SsuB [Microbacterium sp. C448]|uniref:ABC transporter ATP-binding protein n=1 Tax=Microbacterium sp. C448 TaxID=1177594 RepID=UPI0003DE5E99|nr:ABC transporter ATP-binding protein [Microbacterium sp. C448]CDK01791.1 Aliphatic sulfonates import ATP-binding protein SsuB [Microbacterium sp. C448]